MTKEQVLVLCEEIKDKFHLKDWKVKFFIEDIVNGDPDVWGYCEVIHGRKIAYITLASELLGRDISTIKQVICHELIHVHLNAISESTRELLAPLSADMHHSINKIMKLEIERATDVLSFVIVGLLEDKTYVKNKDTQVGEV